VSLLDDIVKGLFDDPDWTDTPPELFRGHMVSDLLPYRLYDPETAIYENAETTGFMFEVTPVVDASEVARNIHSILSANCPTGGGFQVLNWSSPDLEGRFQTWMQGKERSTPLVQRMTAKRLQHLRERRFGMNEAIRSVPVNRRVFVLGWIEGETSLSATKALEEYRRGLKACFGGGVAVQDTTPDQLLKLLSQILHAANDDISTAHNWSRETPLNYQLPGSRLTVSRDGITLGGDPEVSLTSASIAGYPEEWVSSLGSLLVGSPERIHERPFGPVLASLSARAMPTQKAAGSLLKKRASLEHAASTKFGKFVPNFAEKKSEFETLAGEIEGGEKLFETLFVVSAYAKGKPEDSVLAQAEMAKIYRVAGMRFARDTFLQLPLFLSALPFGVTEAKFKDFTRLMRMRLLKGKALSSLAPVHGEWKGSGSGKGLMLLGRQGQVFDWDPYLSEGNYNVAVVGKSGAGKSVFMQELITSIYASGGSALVIDDGYSFKNTCEILEGRHIAFDGSREIRLNPFSALDQDEMVKEEYRSEAIELVTRVIASMAALGDGQSGRVREVEEDYISEAVSVIWAEKGPKGEVSDVRDLLALQAETEERLEDVVRKLDKFSRGGIYGRYFEGEANIQLDSPFTVFELSDIKGQKGLEEVVLQLVMFLGTELMYKSERSERVAILIDEAWDLLKGPGTSKFIEGVVRRARKYTGALITGTQSIDDYFANPAAEVCIQNSDWLVTLAQKPETIDRLMKNSKLSVSAALAEQLKSLQSVPGQFSELAIKGTGGWAFGRLVLDPFSLAVYSSKGATVEAVRQMRSEGLSMVEALEKVVDEGRAV